MSSIVIAYCEQKGLKYRLANNGDDCVLMVEKGDLGALCGIDAWFLSFGFTLTREAPTQVFERIEFCQSQPVLTGSGWRMVRNPLTAMSKDCVSLLSWETVTEFGYWAHSIGSCGLSLTAGVPLWEEWYRRLLRLGVEAPMGVRERVNDCGMGYMAAGVVACEVTAEARVSFYRAFGLTPDMQVALEDEYRQTATISELTPMTYPHVKAIDRGENTFAAWCANKSNNP